MQPVPSISQTSPLVPGLEFGPAPPANAGFQDALWQALEDVQALSSRAQSSVEQSLAEDDLTIVESFTAVREADLALRLMIQIRNKLLDAYQEVQQLRM